MPFGIVAKLLVVTIELGILGLVYYPLANCIHNLTQIIAIFAADRMQKTKISDTAFRDPNSGI